MSSQARSVVATSLVIIFLAASTGVSSHGYEQLLCLLALLTGVNLMALGIWMADNPSATVPTELAGMASLVVGVLATFLRRNLAVIGLITASSASAVVAVAGEASPALCVASFALLLLGVSMITAGVLAFPGKTGDDAVHAAP
ncbi:hypothetical protein BS78_K268000 [Paspalum vaginatum]|uniref:Uncharacterized protein n=1 Tax=Paspalum vaginatum TaxID=158149 RepID=A0A9W7XB20_9POAL|nr:hypothetical protein BS78_K268000 [Paspalum vaginatum]